ncbi:MAG: hypothetical protein ACXWWI_03795, partial [Nitrospira sp.]
MMHVLIRLIGGMGLLTLVGCAGTGEVIPLQLHVVPRGTEKAVKSAEPPKVVIGEFEDGRSVQTGLG